MILYTYIYRHIEREGGRERERDMIVIVDLYKGITEKQVRKKGMIVNNTEIRCIFL
jgi:hypothetical protein